MHVPLIQVKTPIRINPVNWNELFGEITVDNEIRKRRGKERVGPARPGIAQQLVSEDDDDVEKFSLYFIVALFSEI